MGLEMTMYSSPKQRVLKKEHAMDRRCRS